MRRVKEAMLLFVFVGMAGYDWPVEPDRAEAQLATSAEAIANIRKHARPESVAIELRRDPDWLHLVGGTCVIEHGEDRGTRVRVRLPLRT